MKTVFILGINSDIGFNVAKFFLKDGYKIFGTYRKKNSNILLLQKKVNVNLCKCNVLKSKDIINLFKKLKKKNFKWDIFFSAVGTSEPIGNFFSISFKNWKKSVELNFLSQLEVFHKLYALKNNIANIIFLAGGGTNNPFTNYSAYCVSKIALIKMCELLDDENKKDNFFIIGPGLTKTKTHFETLKAKKNAGRNYLRIKKFIASGKQGTSFLEIYDCIRWGIKSGRSIVGGRNVSVVHDNWKEKIIASKLKKDNNLFKLRRKNYK